MDMAASDLDSIDIEIGQDEILRVSQLTDREFEPLATIEEERNEDFVDFASERPNLLSSSGNIGLEWQTVDHSAFALFRGNTFHLFLSQILPYLEAPELVIFGSTCKFFYRMHNHPSLWRALYRQDFLENTVDEPTSSIDDSPSRERGLSIQDELLSYLQNLDYDMDSMAMLQLMQSELTQQRSMLRQSSASSQTSSASNRGNRPLTAPPQIEDLSKIIIEEDGGACKRRYEIRRREYVGRMKRSAEDQRQLEADMRRIDQQRWLEQFLDWTQVRLQPLIWMSSWFLTMVLFMEKLDGLNIPYWACAFPLGFAIVYCFACICLAHHIYKRRFSTTSIWYGLFNNMSGPTTFVYSKVLHHSWKGIAAISFIVLLLLLQLTLVVVKLSSQVPSHTQRELSWGVVFLPLWIFFSMSCLSPLIVRRLEFGAFVLAIVLLWIPLFIILVGLTVKLDGLQDIRMVYLFIPLFIYEGMMMVGSLLFLMFGIYQ